MIPLAGEGPSMGTKDACGCTDQNEGTASQKQLLAPQTNTTADAKFHATMSLEGDHAETYRACRVRAIK